MHCGGHHMTMTMTLTSCYYSYQVGCRHCTLTDQATLTFFPSTSRKPGGRRFLHTISFLASQEPHDFKPCYRCSWSFGSLFRNQECWKNKIPGRAQSPYPSSKFYRGLGCGCRFIREENQDCCDWTQCWRLDNDAGLCP